MLNARPYVRVYGRAAIKEWAERNRCPENDRLCEEAMWFMQNMFLGPRSDIAEIAEPIREIRVRAPHCHGFEAVGSGVQATHYS